MIIKTDDMIFLRAHGKWDLYLKGNSVFAIARMNSGCDSTLFGSLKYYQRFFETAEKPMR